MIGPDGGPAHATSPQRVIQLLANCSQRDDAALPELTRSSMKTSDGLLTALWAKPSGSHAANDDGVDCLPRAEGLVATGGVLIRAARVERAKPSKPADIELVATLLQLVDFHQR